MPYVDTAFVYLSVCMSELSVRFSQNSVHEFIATCHLATEFHKKLL
jgi:hypothetical protein